MRLNNTQKLSWKDVKIYLAGPMDFAADAGMAWRERITNKLIGIGILPDNILNPCLKPASSKGAGLSEEQRLVNEYRHKGDWDGLEALMKQIINLDLRMVDKSDIIIANLSYCDRTVGTIHEIVSASSRHIPVYIIQEKGIQEVSGWLIGLVGNKRVYSSEDDVIKAIHSIKEHGATDEDDMKDYVIFDFAKRDTI